MTSDNNISDEELLAEIEKNHESLQLPWDDMGIDHKFNSDSGQPHSIRLSQFQDRQLALAANSAGLSTSAYILSSLNKSIESDIEKLRIKSEPTVILMTLRKILVARAFSYKKRKNTLKNKKRALKTNN